MTATHPLERVKMMRIFGVKEIANKNFLQSIRKIARSKGITSVFRGNKVSCIREFPGAGLMFYFYERFKSIFVNNSHSNTLNLSNRVLSGAMAGMLTSTITYPLDPVKAIMASDYEGNAGSITQILLRIYRNNGIQGFYHGYSATIMSATSFIGTYFDVNFYFIIEIHHIYANNIALNMTLFDYLKLVFGVSPNSSYFSTVNMLCGSLSGTIC